jgi:hypothetical protein
MTEHDDTLIVFAKTPALGIAKSRIAATEGRQSALRIYKELLSQTSHLVRGRHYHVAYSGSTERDCLKNYFCDSQSYFQQKGDNLGEKLRHSFKRAFSQGYNKVLAIGCDCPYILPEDINHAFEHLTQDKDIVLGPAHDGGYYLVGIKPGGEYIFSVNSWGTEKLFEQTIGLIKQNGNEYALLRPLSDIDTIEDYVKWKKHLTNMAKYHLPNSDAQANLRPGHQKEDIQK